MYIYINGKIIPQEEATISIFDHGFMYGLGIFETFRIYDGHPFLLDNHLERLNESLKDLNIDRQFTRNEVNNIIQQLLQKNEIEHAYIRFNVSAGNGEIGLQNAIYMHPTIIVYIKPLKEAGEVIEKRAQILSIPRNTPEGEKRLKSHHYLNNVLAKREIGEDPQVEGIFLTKDNFLAEGITTNIFWVKNEVLYTPCVTTGILNGITRQFVLAYANNNHWEIREGLFTVEDLNKAEEVFATNSIQEIIPIRSVGSMSFQGVTGRIVQKLLKEYRRASTFVWSIEELGG